MKHIFTAIVLALLGYIIVLQKQSEASEYPFGRYKENNIRENGVSEHRDLDHIDLPYYVGYRAGNSYRVSFFILGSGVCLIGAIGWIAIRKAEGAKTKIQIESGPRD